MNKDYSEWLFNNQEIFDVLESRCTYQLERYTNRTDVFWMIFRKKELEEEKATFESFKFLVKELKKTDDEKYYFELILANKELFYKVWTRFDHMITTQFNNSEKTLAGSQKRTLNEFFIELGLKKEKKSKGLNRKASRKDNPAEEKRREW